MSELPLWWATAGSLGLFLLILAAVWRLPRDAVYENAPDRSRWRDLRLWATVLILIQLGIYLAFL